VAPEAASNDWLSRARITRCGPGSVHPTKRPEIRLQSDLSTVASDSNDQLQFSLDRRSPDTSCWASPRLLRNFVVVPQAIG
jgi:hypothetical protein